MHVDFVELIKTSQHRKKSKARDILYVCAAVGSKDIEAADKSADPREQVGRRGRSEGKGRARQGHACTSHARGWLPAAVLCGMALPGHTDLWRLWLRGRCKGVFSNAICSCTTEVGISQYKSNRFKAKNYPLSL